jgi:hypothetical protein
MLHTETMLIIKKHVKVCYKLYESDSFVMNAQACPQQSHAQPHKALPAHTPTLSPTSARPLPASQALKLLHTPVHTRACLPSPPADVHARPHLPPTPVSPHTPVHASTPRHRPAPAHH